MDYKTPADGNTVEYELYIVINQKTGGREALFLSESEAESLRHDIQYLVEGPIQDYGRRQH